MKQYRVWLVASAASILVTGCGGGGGGGVSSTPAPPTASPAPSPAPTPAPTNTSITDLKVSQNFANDGGTTNVSFNLTSKTTITARAAADALTVRYDASTNSYTISSANFAETFTAADRQPDPSAGEANYRHTAGGTTSYLTLATTPYTSNTPNKYVGLGFLQRNTSTGDRQDSNFSTFAYGLDTPSASVPRTGSGQFAIDVFGLETIPGAEPNTFQGRGRFDVDFVAGQFSLNAPYTLTGLVTGSSVSGGGLEINGGGKLSVTDNRFSGDVVYGSGARRIGGVIAGRFYGPAAEEIGGAFSGSVSDGSAFDGGFTGQRDSSLLPTNISFDRLVTQQLFYGDATALTVQKRVDGSGATIRDYPGSLGTAVSVATLTDQTSGNLMLGTPTSNLPGGQFTTTSIVPGSVNFTSYQKTLGGQPTTLDVYKTGSANRELPLTYSSFAKYSTINTSNSFFDETTRLFFTYGFRTPGGLFLNRTGTANYAGVAYGAAARPDGTINDVTGTSQASLNFGSMSMSASVALKTAGAASIDYGTFAFTGTIAGYQSQAVGDLAGPNAFGSMLLDFYGPSGDEAGGPFRVSIANGANAGTLINGVVVAKKQ